MQYAGSWANRRAILFWVPVVCGEGRPTLEAERKGPRKGVAVALFLQRTERAKKTGAKK